MIIMVQDLTETLIMTDQDITGVTVVMSKEM
jgi:hypothetical protein